MIIALDGYEANQNARVGIGRYAYELLKHIYDGISEKRLKTKEKVIFRIYLPEEPNADMPKSTDWWQYRVVPRRGLWTFFGFPMVLSSDSPKADVVFSPTHYIPRFTSIPRVMSIMDLSYLSYPDMFKAKDLFQLRNWTAYSVRHAAHIFTISEFSRHAIIDAYGVVGKKVTVTYLGLPKLHTILAMEKTNMKSREDLAKEYHVREEYILSVGTLQPRKNYVRLIEAFSLFLKKYNSPIDLVIIGKKGWLYDEILTAPKQFGVEDRVKFLDFVPDADLPSFYKHALCFALPSLYEGFGLPVLEAMTQGTQVVVSNVSSLPEIAGDAGIYVNPEEVSDISQGLLKAVSERDQKEGKERVNKGLTYIKKFSWDTAAKQTLEVLENIAKKP